MNIYIDKIAIDPKIVGRANGLDSDTVESYADDMEGGAVFPPIEVVSDGDIFWLVDGQHRLEAAPYIGSIHYCLCAVFGNISAFCFFTEDILS